MDASDYQNIHNLLEDYLRMYSSRDDLLTKFFSEDFSGFTGGGDFLVKDREEWIAITRQDFAQVKDPLRLELKDLAIQSLAETIAVATSFFTIHLPIKDHILSRETARLVLIFRKESENWKITHSSISIPYYLVREGEVYPLQELVERNRFLEEQVEERTAQLSESNNNLQHKNEEMAREIAERKHVEDALRKSEERNRNILHTAMDGFWMSDSQGRLKEVNIRYCQMSGYSEQELLTMNISDLEVIETADDVITRIQKLAEIGEARFESQHRRKNGSIFDVEVSAQYHRIEDGQVVAFLRDIGKRKQTEVYREIGRDILQILNETSSLQDSIQRVLTVLKSQTGFDAVGIRLQDGTDFPYLGQKGFSKDFLLKENSLIERTADEGGCRCDDGKVSLECTCGLVISGKTDPDNPLFSPGGSFWTNDSFPLLDIPLSEDPRLHPRNLCVHEGYASFALVPIRNKDRIVGLIQLNDKRKGCFTLHTVELLEGIASHIGEAMMRKQAEEELQKKDAEIEKQHAELRKNSRFIENLVMRSAAPMFVLDQNHHILFWNQALTKLTGLKSEQMRGSDLHWQPFYPEKRPTMADLVLDKDEKNIPAFYDNYRKSELVEGAMQSEGWFRFPDHGKRYLYFHASPITDDDGNIVAVVETLEDLTIAKQIEGRLNDQFRFLQQVLDSLPIGVFYTNRNGAFIGCNRSFEEFFGRDQHYLMGKQVSDLNPDEFAHIHAGYAAECMKNDSIQTYEASLVRADGAVRQLIATKAPLHLSSGKVNGLVGAFTDITERKQTEIALQESEEKFRSISDSAQDAIIMIDNSGLVTFWNAAAEKIFGYDKDEILGRQFYEHIVSPDLRDIFTTGFADFQESGLSLAFGKTIEMSAIRKGGLEIPIEISLSAVRLGGQWCATGLARDISARKEAQKFIAASQAALKAKHDELNHLFNLVAAAKLEWEQTLDSVKDIIILVDATHHIRRCNRMLFEITGKVYEDLVHQDWREVLAGSGFNFVKFDGKTGELLHAGTQHQFDLNIYEIHDPDRETAQGLVVSMNDVTDIKEMTRKLEEAHDELISTQTQVVQQEKMASIGQMAAGVAHEINNPMAFISCNINTLGKYMGRLREYQAILKTHMGNCLDSSKQEIDEAQRRLKIDYILDDTGNLVNESLEGAERVRKIVQALKVFSRIDQADEEFADIIQCLESTINIVWNEIKYVATLQKEFGDIPKIKCFPQQLNQVFMNLLVNAAHAISGMGEITVRTWHDTDSIFVSVSDTGSGIPVAIQQRIFEPFFTTKEAGKGTGLGLPISFDIVKKHGGDLMFATQLGLGTTFTVRLPINYVQ